MREEGDAIQLREGDPAPELDLQDADGKTWRLEDIRGRKVILYFYPVDDTPGCTTQACDFRDAQLRLTEAGYRVLGVSPQGAESHLAFAEKYGLNFPLLIDEGLALAERYGAVKHVGDGADSYRSIKRSTFVIDHDGRIEKAMYGVRAKDHVAGLMESLAL